MRPYGKEPKNKFVRARPKAEIIILMVELYVDSWSLGGVVGRLVGPAISKLIRKS